MAKKKETETIAEQVAEVVEEVEQVEEKKMSEKEKTELFISNQLKAINRMSNKARARRLATRVINNRKGL